MVMTKLLNKVFETLSAMPHDRQDEVARMLLDLVEQDQSRLRLSDDQRAEVEKRLKAPAEYASDEEVEAFFRKRGV
jgi:hypothetical protein